jgi:hypothetical protein
MFANLGFLFGQGLGVAPRNVCANTIELHGGKLLKRPKYPARFKKAQAYTPLDSAVTHILVDDQNIRHADLCNYFHSIGIPPTVKIVHWHWLRDCVTATHLCDTSLYELGKSNNSATKKGTKRACPSSSASTFSSFASAPPIATPPSSNISFAFNFGKPQASASTSFSSSLANISAAPTPTQPAPIPIAVTAPAIPVTTSSKRGKTSAIDCLDAHNTSFSSPTFQSMGNGWFLLHNMIDGKQTPSLLFKFSPVQKSCTSVVGFDMDGTIITTKSGLSPILLLLI